MLVYMDPLLPYSEEKRKKGRNLYEIPSDYVLIDIETTGFSTQWDEVIELAAVRIRNHEIVDKFESLVKPKYKVSEFITSLTGISNEMLIDAPPLVETLETFLDFIGDDIIIGHNIHFDISFIYDNSKHHLDRFFSNDFVDSRRICRKIVPDLSNYKLKKLVKHFKLPVEGSHRALPDALAVYELIQKLLSIIESDKIDVHELFKTSIHDAREISPTTTNFDTDHPFYGKHFVFTGVLEKMLRADAFQLVVDKGGICQNGINKDTNFLVLGNNDYCSSIKDGKSKKQKKAEDKILSGQDLVILPENIFYEMIDML